VSVTEHVTTSKLALHRTLWRIIPAFQLAMISFWTTTTLTTLLLIEGGESAATIGLFTALPWLAVLTATPVLPRLVVHLGLRASFQLGALLPLASTACFALSSNLFVWVVANAVLGLGLALRWISADSWVIAAAPPHRRGQVIGLYETLASVLIGSGPLVLAATGIDGALPFLVVAGLLIASLLCLTGSGAPYVIPRTRADAGSLRAVLRRAPLLGLTALLSGLVEGAGVGLFPVYGVALGFAPTTAALLVSVLALGNVVTQYPLSALADRVPLAAVLRACLVVMIVAPLAWSLLGPGSPLLWPLLFAWGGTTGMLYTLASLAAGQRFHGGELIQAIAACAMLYTLGSVIGPGLGGVALTLWAPHGLTVGLVLVGLLALAALHVLPRLEERYERS
jgi:MFS family permease